MSVLVLPKYHGYDREYRRPLSGQEQLERQTAGMTPVRPVCASESCGNQIDPGHDQCLFCCRWKIRPALEAFFMATTIGLLQQKRSDWEGMHTGWRLALAGEWVQVQRTTKSFRLGQRLYAARYLIRRR